MKFLHLADLHFGKMLHGISLLENGDQLDWVQKLIKLVEEKRPDAVVIAGDVYDRGMPPGAAMQLLSEMVTGISMQGIPVMIAAGNHDSGQRLACFKDILSRQNVYISGILEPELTHISLYDDYGPVTFWLLPYTFPAAVSQVLADDTIHDYDTAIRRILAEQPIDFSGRNVLVAHQNVTMGGVDGIRGGSESVVGGVGQVDYTAFDGFDYVALGHIHAAYPVGRPAVRYAGSPLCYHFDELRQQKKGPVLVELREKGVEPAIETLTIPPLHTMRELRGTYEEIQNAAQNAGKEEYIKLVLTDKRWTPENSAYFEALFKARNSILMERTSEFSFFDGTSNSPELNELENKSVETLFAEFYTERAGKDPEEQELALMHHTAELLHNSDAGADGKFVDPALVDKVLDYLTQEE